MKKESLLDKIEQSISGEEDYIEVLANTYKNAMKNFYGENLDPRAIEIVDKIINDSKNHKETLKDLKKDVENNDKSDY